MTDRTLAVHLHRFSKKERGLIMWAINGSNILGYEIHHGSLPFVAVEKAMAALELYGTATMSGKRVRATIQSKIKRLYGNDVSTVFYMWLNPAKVAKRFGPHPERGHRIPLAPAKKVTVGVRWSLPKKDYVPDDDVLVQPHLTLTACSEVTQGSMKFAITCEDRYHHRVSTFLSDYCT